MRYSYVPEEYANGEVEFFIVDAIAGRDNPLAWTEDRDVAEKIVKALNAVFDGPFALDSIPKCVTEEIS